MSRCLFFFLPLVHIMLKLITMMISDDTRNIRVCLGEEEEVKEVAEES